MSDNTYDQEANHEREHFVETESVGALYREERNADGSTRLTPACGKRPRVTITCYLTRPLDPCNISTKSLVDGLRIALLLADDRPQDIDLRIRQVKVDTIPEEKTVVEIAPI